MKRERAGPDRATRQVRDLAENIDHPGEPSVRRRGAGGQTRLEKPERARPALRDAELLAGRSVAVAVQVRVVAGVTASHRGGAGGTGGVAVLVPGGAVAGSGRGR